MMLVAGVLPPDFADTLGVEEWLQECMERDKK